MPCRRYVLYMTWNRTKYRLGISANPQIDLTYLQEQDDYESMAFLSPPLPLALSEYLLNMFSTPRERTGKPYNSFQLPFLYKPQMVVRSILKAKFRKIKKELGKYGQEYVATEPVFCNNTGVNIDYYSLNYFEDVVEYILQGRIFYLHEINRRLKERNIEIKDLETILHLLTLKGQVVRVPSVKYSARGEMACNRCGHQYKIVRQYCNEGKKDCYYCQECLMLGESKPCEALYAAPAKPRIEENFVKSIRLNLDIAYSLSQYEAFEHLIRFVRKDGLSECLVWEACGAGRPEVVFGAVREVLKRGGKVLFGVPRKDILEDLVTRLERAFPGVNVAVRYGKSKTYLKNSDIILASTHHALKYYKNFDLVILDESEAFPYRANPILINALRRAKKSDGKLIYITPTPAPDIYARAQRGEMKVVQIPVRQHGHPLVVPQVIVDKEMMNEMKNSEVIFQLVRESLEENQAPVLIVVPNAYYSKRVGEWLANRLAGLRIAGLKPQPVIYTDAQDPGRDKKVAAYFRDDHNILVTTSLTRRGDWGPNSNVMVLWADNECFDEGSLLQMAGRVGWSEAYPTGKVWFVVTHVTREIEGAIRKIKLLNDEANKKGHFDTIKQKKTVKS